jgi:hypothetical protein
MIAMINELLNHGLYTIHISDKISLAGKMKHQMLASTDQILYLYRSCLFSPSLCFAAGSK